MGVRKQRLRITPRGRGVLEAEHLVYQRLFSAPQNVVLTGAVKAGLGEGRYYLSRPGYLTQFKAKLGWEPFPGTLNLELGEGEAAKLDLLRRNAPVTIDAFTAEGRTFGAVSCLPAKVGGHACAAILPHRSHYTTTLEVIAPVRLRDAIPCQDGQRLTVAVDLRRA
jgi:riboflavin kinase